MVEGRQAGRLGHLLQYMREYKAKSPKQGRKRFNSIVKTVLISYLPIIYLWRWPTREDRWREAGVDGCGGACRFWIHVY